MNSAKGLKKAYRGVVEMELRNYYWTKERLQEMDEEIAEGGIVMRARLTPRSRQISKPTEDKGIRLAYISEDDGIKHVRKVLKAIEFVKDRAYGTKEKIMRLYFFESKPPEMVCSEAHVSRTCMYDHAKEIIEDVAELLGYSIK